MRSTSSSSRSRTGTDRQKPDHGDVDGLDQQLGCPGVLGSLRQNGERVAGAFAAGVFLDHMVERLRLLRPPATELPSDAGYFDHYPYDVVTLCAVAFLSW